ncbi:NgoMIV family type II restriction endonuclease [Jiangella rhizosphaerae]|uniref:NgoMIV family type II restriction endonuclease n=1 Tax=Jiangella rhizosphaerae TaxID=2293569 RepID=UPI001314F5E1|nr:NgoMIV family type II restriction endonuclease [Jiangella rhizosphaerae]
MKYVGEPLGPNLADLSGPSSVRIAKAVYEILNIRRDRRTTFDIGSLERKEASPFDDRRRPRAHALAAGIALEVGLEQDIYTSLKELAPGRAWKVTRRGSANQFAQYRHLAHLQELLKSDPTLKTTVGRDYTVSSDVMVGLPNPRSANLTHVLHAAVSCKLTIRSDRVQNVRVEFGTLVRNRRGRLPHLVVVTAEPLPSRLVSIGRGTGEIDTIYHLLFEQIDEALESLRNHDRFMNTQWQGWRELVEMERIRPYSELSSALANG